MASSTDIKVLQLLLRSDVLPPVCSSIFSLRSALCTDSSISWLTVTAMTRVIWKAENAQLRVPSLCQQTVVSECQESFAYWWVRTHHSISVYKVGRLFARAVWTVCITRLATILGVLQIAADRSRLWDSLFPLVRPVLQADRPTMRRSLSHASGLVYERRSSSCERLRIDSNSQWFARCTVRSTSMSTSVTVTCCCCCCCCCCGIPRQWWTWPHLLP